MSRTLKRVPLDFGWPLNKRWAGYLMPEWLYESSCPDCELGYSAEAHRFYQEWYGYVPFDPASTGSAPFTVDTPEVRARASRNVEQSPHFYGTGEAVILREAERLLALWNTMWMHHLCQEDVDALVDGGRLWDFTRRFVPGEGWQDRETPYRPTAAEVNAWSLVGFGHDGLNAGIAIEARCEREGVPRLCATCSGAGSLEKFGGQRATAEAWQRLDPPTGDGWQIWETTSEGSPITPVFATSAELASYYAARHGGTDASVMAWIDGPGWAPSGIVTAGGVQTADDLIVDRSADKSRT